MVHKTKWVSIDGWRGYYQPLYAVAGSSLTGDFSDSPAPTSEVKREMKKLKDYLDKKGIKTRFSLSRSSNLFMQKVWLVPKDISKFGVAKKLANEWLKRNYNKTHYVHEAD